MTTKMKWALAAYCVMVWTVAGMLSQVGRTLLEHGLTSVTATGVLKAGGVSLCYGCVWCVGMALMFRYRQPK